MAIVLIVLSEKSQIRIFCEYAHLHIMSFITTKFHEILFRGFWGVVLRNCYSSLFNFDQISKLKNGIASRKKNWTWIFCNVHSTCICPSLLKSIITTKFCSAVLEELHRQTVLAVYFSKFKRGITPRRKFHLSMHVLHKYKVQSCGKVPVLPARPVYFGHDRQKFTNCRSNWPVIFA